MLSETLREFRYELKFTTPQIRSYTFEASGSYNETISKAQCSEFLGRHYRSRLDIDLFPRKLFNSDSRDTVLRKLKNRGYGEKERERASRRVVIAATGYRRRRHANSHNVATRNHRRLFFFPSFFFPSQAYRGAAAMCTRNAERPIARRWRPRGER